MTQDLRSNINIINQALLILDKIIKNIIVRNQALLLLEIKLLRSEVLDFSFMALAAICMEEIQIAKRKINGELRLK